MRKSIPVSARLLAVLLVLALALGMFPVGVIAETPGEGNQEQSETTVAVIGEEEYTTLADAVKDAAEGAVIELTADSAGSGIIIDKNLTIDLGGYTYTVSGSPVGSAGTETLGFQILAGHTVKMLNGSVNTSTDEVKMLIQNYSNLELTNVQLDGTGSTTMKYVLSNNCGNVVLNGSTGIKAAEGVKAFDVCDYANYDHPTVTVDTTGTITGIVEVSPTGVTLNVADGIFNGDLVVLGDDGELDDATISISGGAFTDTEDAQKYLAEDLQMAPYGNVVSGDVAKIGDMGYSSLKEAVVNADPGATITLLCDVVGPGIVINNDLVIDFGGNTYTVSCEPVGSTGTETLGFQILKNHNVTLKNGTFRTNTEGVKMLVQNYSNLTVTDMTLDGTGSTTMKYVLSNNCGKVAVNGKSNIIAPEGAVALDAFDYSSGGYALPEVTVDTTGKVVGKLEVSDGVGLTVLGGTFSADVTAYLPEGSNLIQIDGTVAKKPAAQIGDKTYATLAEALDDAADNAEIKLLYSTEGEGLVINKNVTVDFGGNTYTVNSTVGSAGTVTLGLQILKGNTVVLKNGTINTNTDSVKMLVQNYANLTVTDMVLDGTGSANMKYVLSNNCGEVTVDGTTDIIAPNGAVALDSCKFMDYDAPTVTVDTTGSITGNIEVSDTATLAIKNGNFTVDVSDWLADGFKSYESTDDEGGTYYDVAPQELTIEFVEPDAVAELNGVTYVKSGSKITVVVTDESGILELKILNANGEDITGKVTAESASKWTATVAIPDEGLSGLTVIATDSLDRESTQVLSTVYAVDTTAPLVDVTVNPIDGATANTVGDVDYYNGGVEYVITVKDPFIDENGIKISYILNGERKTAEAQYTADTIRGDKEYRCVIRLEGDGKIEGLSVTATDLCDNATTATGTDVVVDTVNPKAELSVSDNVTGVVIKEGKTFLVIGEVLAKNEAVVTVTVSDANLDETALENNGWDKVDGVWTMTYSSGEIAEHDTGKIAYDFAVTDLAGRKLADVLSWSKTESSTSLTITPAEGAYNGELYIDCRAPGSGEPTAEAPVLNLTHNSAAVQNGELYSGNVEFSVEVNDKSVSGYDSGVASVEVSVDDNLADVEFLTCGEVTENNGIYTFSVNCSGQNETNNAKLQILVTDHAGNQFPYSYTIAVDNKASVVELDYDNDKVSNDKYFDADRTLTVTVTDINFVAEQALADTTGTAKTEWTKVEGAEYTYQRVYTFGEGEHTFALSVTDKAGNVTNTEQNTDNLTWDEGTCAAYAFIIDKTAPVVKVEKEIVGGELVRSDDTTDYYRASYMRYTVSVSDAYLYSAAVKATYEDGTPVEILPDAADGTFTFSIDQAKTLTDISIDVADCAGNHPASIAPAGNEEIPFTKALDDENNWTGVWNYDGKDVAVDHSAPVVNVSKAVNGTYAQTKDGYDYYNAESVTYTIVITDAFLQKPVVQASFSDGTVVQADGVFTDIKYGAEDRYEAQVTVKPGADLTGLTIDVMDQAENRPASVASDDDKTFFEIAENGFCEYKGNKVAVSTDDPVVEVDKVINNGNFFDTYHDDNYDHYKADSVTYKITVSDSYLEKAIVTLTYWTGEPIVLNIADAVAMPQDGEPLTDGIYVVSQGEGVALDQYLIVFTVTEGQTLKDIQIDACGYVGRYPSVDTVISNDDRTTFADEDGDGIWNYSGKTVVVDNTEPEITVTKEIAFGGTFVQTAGGYDYYRANSVIYTVTAKDAYLNPNAGIGRVLLTWANGEYKTFDITAADDDVVVLEIKDGPEEDTVTFTIVVKDDLNAVSDAEVLKNISINVADNAGNRKAADIDIINDQGKFVDADENGVCDGIYEYKGSMVVVDITAPSVTVDKVVDNDGSAPQSDDKFDYYKANGVKYAVTIKDAFLNKGIGKSVVTLSYWGSEDVVLDITTAISVAEGTDISTLGDGIYEVSSVAGAGMDEYVIIFTVAAGEILTGVEIVVEDNAGNTPKKIDSSDALTFFEDKDDAGNTDGIWNYAGKNVAVDKTAPVVTIDKVVNDGAYTRSDVGFNYYKAEGVTYTVTVTDNHLNIGEGGVGTAVITLTYWGGTTREVEPVVTVGEGPAEDKYVFTFTVEKGQTLTDISIDVKDNAGNTPEEIVSSDALTSFEDQDADGIWNYAGKNVVVDNTAPVVKVYKEGTFEQEDDGYDYYSTNVKYKIGISDYYLNTGVGGITITLTYWDGTVQVLDIVDGLFDNEELGLALETFTSVDGPEKDQYVFSIEVPVGNPLKGIEVNVADNAGNTPVVINTEKADRTPFEDADADGVWNYTGKMVVVDTTAPEIGIEKEIEENGEYIQSADGYDYYNAGKVTYTVTITDNYLTTELGKAFMELLWTDGKDYLSIVDEECSFKDALTNFTISKSEKDGPEKDTYTFTFTVVDGEGLASADEILQSILLSAQDNAKNQVTGNVTTNDPDHTSFEDADKDGIWEYTGNFVVTDKTAPVVEVDKVVNNGSYTNSDAEFDYYQSESVTYTVTVSDEYLNVGVGQAVITLTYWDGTVETLDISEPNSKISVNSIVGHELDEYVFTIIVEEGKPLEAIRIDVNDNSGNAPKTIIVNDADGLTSFVEKVEQEGDEGAENVVWNYLGKIVAVDDSAPEVKVNKIIKGGQFVQTYMGHDYYDAESVTYTVTVTDSYLNIGIGEAVVTLTYWDGSIETLNINRDCEEISASSAEGPDKDQYIFTFTVDESKVLSGISIDVIDNAGNTPKQIDVTDSNSKTSFAESDGVWNYTGNGVVVDMTAPVINLSFSSNVRNVYVNNGIVYVRLDPAIELESGVASNKPAETVTMTVTVTDKNLMLDAGNRYGVSGNPNNGGVWSGETAVNYLSELTYRQTVTVSPDKTGLFTYELKVFDLAGNTVDKFFSKAVLESGTSFEVTLNNGVFGNTIAVDRRRPSTETGDILAPEIKIVPNGAANMTATANGLDLFDGEFVYNLSITDLAGVAEANSGLRYVEWTMSDPVGFANVTAGSGSKNFDVYSREFAVGIPVKFNAANGESNSVTLNIKAIDNAGNVITYIKEFAIDNLTPRVELIYSNDDVRNEEYFKEDRIITVKVTDINFNADTTSVDTQVNGSGWERQGDTYTQTFEYRTDGHYTFAMSTTDYANNVTDTTDNTGNLNTFDHVALYKFTVDKTKPVIDVTIDGNGGLKNTVGGVDYYAAAQTVKVEIVEHNFNASEVIATLTKGGETDAGRTLGTWTDTGDRRENYISYSEDGNRYKAQIQYTDLAGNVGTMDVTNEFTVDTKAPTITIDQADFVEVVPGTLTLSFHMADAELNMNPDTVSVVLYRLGANFEQVELDESYYTVNLDDPNNVQITINNPDESDKGNDGIYTVVLNASDYSANAAATLTQEYSLNRFGSTFLTKDDYTKEVLKLHQDNRAYVNKVEKPLVIIEKNPNKIYQTAEEAENAGEPTGSKITVSVNGNTLVLVKDRDYTMTRTAETEWYEYTYCIDPAVFENADGSPKNGRYDIYFYSVDEAGNINSNEANQGSQLQLDKDGNDTGMICFYVDSAAPVVTLMGIDLNKTTHNADFVRPYINISDNSYYTISATINGTEIKVYREMPEGGLKDNEDWICYNSETGNWDVNITAKGDRQSLVVTVADEAGNEATDNSFDGITVNTSAWIRFRNNTPLVVGSIVGVVLVLALIIFLIVKRKKKEKPEEAPQA